MKKLLILLVFAFAIQSTLFSQSFARHSLFGNYIFEIEDDSARILWSIDLCKDSCFAMDTLVFVHHNSNNSKDDYMNLEGDYVEISHPDIKGNYELSHDTLFLIWGKKEETTITLQVIDSLNVKMLHSDINGPFKNKFGNKLCAYYSHHVCGDYFSYLYSMKWSYGTEDYGSQKRKSFWSYFDSLSETPWLWDYKIPDTNKVSRYLH